MSVAKQSILLAEDNDDDFVFLERALKEAGLTNPLQRLADGQQTIDYLSGQGQYSDRDKYPMPWMVFLDLYMPVKTGIEVLRWIQTRPELRTLIVVVLTSSEKPEDARLAYRLGARSYLLKRPGVEQLKELIEALKVCWVGYGRIPIGWQGNFENSELFSGVIYRV